MSTVSECDSRVSPRADCTEFIIKIDDYYFRILNIVFIKKKKRKIINIYSSQIKEELIKDSEIDFKNVNKFSVYFSNSELGCFRLCLYDAYAEQFIPNQKFIKGDEDYIQQTFIHVKLQKFIHECLDKLDTVVLYKTKLYKLDKDLNKYILVETSNICYCMINPENNYDKKYINIGEYNKINTHIDLISRKIKKEPFKEYSNNKCGQDQNKTNENIINELNNFSIKLKSLYDYSNNKSISNIIINDIENVYDLKFYKVELKLKEENIDNVDNIILYYCNAKIITFMTHQFEPPKLINLPVFLTTEEGDKITEFGTFNKYILAGNYICKVFDYSIQCSIDQPGECYGDYKLIGERYNNIFPLLEIRKQLELQQTTRSQQTARYKQAARSQQDDRYKQAARSQQDVREEEESEEELEEELEEFLEKEAREEEDNNYKQFKELLEKEEKDIREKLLVNDQKVAKELQEEDRDRQLARQLAGGVIQIINDRCDSNIKNIRDSNCNQKIQKIQNVYNVRKQLIEDTERFFNKKINYLTI